MPRAQEYLRFFSSMPPKAIVRIGKVPTRREMSTWLRQPSAKFIVTVFLRPRDKSPPRLVHPRPAGDATPT